MSAVHPVLLIADLAAGSHSRVARPLAWRPVVSIGKISHGPYLIERRCLRLQDRFEAPARDAQKHAA